MTDKRTSSPLAGTDGTHAIPRFTTFGILAHVDAGKTTLTERLLHVAGVIDEPGSVDAGTTRTDTLALERERGITIRSAVVSFPIDDVIVNLIDTPGHPDFIAEVERSLAVLDGAVLVVSAVEGVQPQTRILMRALQRLRLPTLIFVNKVDRRGADSGRVVAEIETKLGVAPIPLGTVRGEGTRAAVHIPFVPDDSETLTRLAAVLAERSDELLAAYVEGTQAIRYELLQTELVAQSRAAEVCPVFVGSALTGAGVRDLLFGIAELLPTDSADAEGPTHGTVFKVDRIESGAKVAYVRVHSGTIRVRDRLPISHGGLEPSREGKVTGITVFDKGSASAQTVLPAGRLGTVRGLADVRVGDILGTERESTRYARHFAPPTLEAIVVPRDPVDRGALRSALSLLAEQDPLIDVRQNDATQEISVSLYGEVQKEVIQATLANDFDIVVEFRETTTVYIERPIGTGEYVARLYEEAEPFLAGVGLRVDPAATESGVEFRLEVELGSMPYAFFRAVKETVGHALSQGLYGWRVTDCRVTMTHSAYLARQSSAHGVFDKNSSSTAGDFRNLTPLVLLEALRRAGTQVCEPIHQFELEIPAELVGTILSTLARLRAVPQTPAVRGSAAVVRGDIPAASVHELERRLPALTGGEGLIEVAFARYDPVRGAAPIAPRRDSNPLDRNEYLLRVVRRVPGGPG